MGATILHIRTATSKGGHKVDEQTTTEQHVDKDITMI